MIRINKIRLATLFLVGILLISCGTIEPKPTQKTIEKETVAKPIEFSFETLPEYDEITTENSLIKQLVINIPANAATESVECKISLSDTILWSKTIETNPSDKEHKIIIDVDPYQFPKELSLPANYKITGLSNIGIETSLPVEINDPNIVTRMMASKTFASKKAYEFINEYGKSSKIKHSFASGHLVAILDERDQLDFYLFDYPISEAQSKVVFSKVETYDCKGFGFINNITFNYALGREMTVTEFCFFRKDNKSYAVTFGHPFSGYLESWGEVVPMLEYDNMGKPFRSLPETKTPSQVLEKLSETNTEIIFGDKQISYIYNKARGLFTKIEAKPMP